MSRNIAKPFSPESMPPRTNLPTQCESQTNVLVPRAGDSIGDLAYARGLVRSLLAAGDIPGAINLMVCTRSLIEQAHSQAITDGILLGTYAMKRLGNELMEALSASLAEVRLASEDDFCDIIDATSEFIKSQMEKST